MKILIVKDFPPAANFVGQKLKEEGCVCEFVQAYEEAVEKLALYEYDCILLNYYLNDGSIFNFLQIQEQNNKSDGLLVLSDVTEVAAKVALFNRGIDDFITVPFDFSELHARMHAVIRRKKFQTNSKIYFANLVIEFHSRLVYVWNNPVDLTKKEYEILLHLIASKDKVVSRLSLAEYLWGDQTDDMDSFNILSAHIKNIRRKMKLAKAEIEIKNSYGIGYQIIEL